MDPIRSHRLRIVAGVVAGVGLMVSVALVGGCSPPAPDDPHLTPTSSPTSSPAPSATSTGFAFDGTFGPGQFTRAVDSCDPPFFGASFTGSFLMINNATFVSLFESQRRDSTCVFNATARLATCTGSGVVGTSPATWDDFVQFTQDGSGVHAVLTETLRLTQRNNCGTVYTSGVLNKQ